MNTPGSIIDVADRVDEPAMDEGMLANRPTTLRG